MSSQRETFAHFDKIAATPKGAVLMVCEPIMASRGGEPMPLAPGLYLRVVVMHEQVGMYAQVAIDGRIITVFVGTRDFTLLEPKES